MKEVEKLRELSKVARVLTDPAERNRLRFEIAKILFEIRDRRIYRQLGYRNFGTFLEREVGLKRRTAELLIEAYLLTKDRPEVFVKAGYRKVILLAKKYGADFSEELANKSLREAEEDQQESKEKKRKQLKRQVIEFGLEFGLDELREVLKEAVMVLKERKERNS